MINLLSLLLLFSLTFLIKINVNALPSSSQCVGLFRGSDLYIPKSVEKDQFIKDRALVEYVLGLYSYAGVNNFFKGKFQFSFAKDLYNLNKDSLIVDFGDGDGTAMTGLFQTHQHYKSESKDWYSNELAYNKKRVISKAIFSLISSRSNKFWSFVKSIWTSMVSIGTSYYNSLGRPLDLIFLYHSKLAENFLSRPIEDRPKALGISFSQSENPLVKEISSLKRFTHRYFEDIPIHEIPNFQLGISYFGIFSYTSFISQSLYKAILKLDMGGRLYIFGMESFVELNSGEIVHISNFLRNYGSGFNVYTRNLNNISIVVIEKSSSDIQIPRLIYDSEKGDYPPVFQFKTTKEFEK